MKSIFLALILAPIAAASWAQPATAQKEGPEAYALRSDCAATTSAKLNAKPQAANEFVFVYYKGEYKGEATAGGTLDCTERQYAAYLNTVDPSRVMSAYPTAAGRPQVKPTGK
nr:hypothetical protein [uncultured Roseateles sp.]